MKTLWQMCNWAFSWDVLTQSTSKSVLLYSPLRVILYCCYSISYSSIRSSCFFFPTHSVVKSCFSVFRKTFPKLYNGHRDTACCFDLVGLETRRLSTLRAPRWDNKGTGSVRHQKVSDHSSGRACFSWADLIFLRRQSIRRVSSTCS